MGDRVSRLAAKYRLAYENDRLETVSGRTETVEFEADDRDELIRQAAVNTFETVKHNWSSVEEMLADRDFRAWAWDKIEEVAS